MCFFFHCVELKSKGRMPISLEKLSKTPHDIPIKNNKTILLHDKLRSTTNEA